MAFISLMTHLPTVSPDGAVSANRFFYVPKGVRRCTASLRWSPDHLKSSHLD